MIDEHMTTDSAVASRGGTSMECQCLWRSSAIATLAWDLDALVIARAFIVISHNNAQLGTLHEHPIS